MYFFDAGFPASNSSANDFTVTAPSSHSQFFSALKSIPVLTGKAKKRSLLAPSDQKGALIEYGITPAAILWLGPEVNNTLPLHLPRNGGSLAFRRDFSTLAK